MLALQRREMAFSLLRLNRGSYKFTPTEVPFEEGVDTLVNVESLLMEGSRQMDEWPEVLRKIPTDTRVYKRSPQVRPGRELAEEEMIVLGLTDGTMTVREIVDRSRLGEFAAWEALAKLYDEGLILPLDTGKRRTVKPAAAFDVRAINTRKGLDRPVGLALLAVAALLACWSVFLKSPAGLGFGVAREEASRDFKVMEKRVNDLENVKPVLPDKVQKKKASLTLPSEVK